MYWRAAADDYCLFAMGICGLKPVFIRMIWGKSFDLNDLDLNSGDMRHLTIGEYFFMSTNKLQSALSTKPNSSDRLSVKSKTQQTNAGLVIVGAGMAGSRFAIELARARHCINADNKSLVQPITLISQESHVGYNRIMLSPVLAGETAFEQTYLYEKSDYEQLGIKVLAGISVTKLESKQRCIELSDGQILSYDQLVIATGSAARILPFPNHKAKGVHVFRDLTDVTVLTQYAHQGKTGLVIGGGVLGLEAACALAAQGAKMCVIHASEYVLNNQLDRCAAELLHSELSRRDVGLEVSATTEAIVVNAQGEVCGLSLTDGRTLAADFVVMAVGVIPNTQLAKESGLKVNQGIIVDDCMHTSCPDIYAIGECIEHKNEVFGMVSPVNQQVDTLVSVLKNSVVRSTSTDSKQDREVSKEGWQPFISKPLSLKLKVSGVSAFSAGQIVFDDSETANIETLVYRQSQLNHYHCLYLKGNKLVGAVLYGEINDGRFYSQLIADNLDITPIKETLIFGEAYCDLSQVKTSKGISL